MPYADPRDIEAQLNHILNRLAAETYSHEGDTSPTRDKRYADETVVESRRKAGYRILEAIGSNPSHPYWGDLSEYVTVAHRSIIPPCLGEIGIPEIKAYPDTYFLERSVVGTTQSGVSTTTFSLADAFSSADVGMFVYLGGVLYGEITGATSDTIEVDAAGPGAPQAGVDIEIRSLRSESFLPGVPAAADWIESVRSDRLGTYTNPLGDGQQPHNELQGTGLPSSVCWRYSTDNGVLRFTGHECRIPMVKLPDLPYREKSSIVASPLVILLTGSNNVELASGSWTTADIGRTVVTSVGNMDGQIISISGVSNEIALLSGPPSDATPLTAIPATVYENSLADFVDTRIPVDLAALNVKLALPLLVKEGDNAFRIAITLGNEGERELINIKSGGIKVNPIDPARLIQFSQRVT